MSTRRFLLDADAYNHLRSLGFISRFAAIGVKILLTEYVGRRELCQLSTDIMSLEKSGTIEVMSLSSRDAVFQRLKRDGVDKGEAESIAWTLSLPPSERPLFISCDKGALKTAKTNEIECGDVLDLLISLIDDHRMSEEEVQERLLPWEDRRQQRGRPADFSTFKITVQRRRSRRSS